MRHLRLRPHRFWLRHGDGLAQDLLVLWVPRIGTQVDICRSQPNLVSAGLYDSPNWHRDPEFGIYGSFFEGETRQVRFPYKEDPSYHANTTGCTLTAWVRTPSAATGGVFARFGDGNGASIGIGNGTFDSNGNGIVVLHDQVRWIATGSSYLTGEWQHIALVIQDTRTAVFHNGVSVYDATPGQVGFAGGIIDDISFGGDAQNGRYGTCDVAEGRFYGRALSLADIQALAGDARWSIYGQPIEGGGPGTPPTAARVSFAELQTDMATRARVPWAAFEQPQATTAYVTWAEMQTPNETSAVLTWAALAVPRVGGGLVGRIGSPAYDVDGDQTHRIGRYNGIVGE
jgi:hypothetical protein